jgi:hypothetical protein
MNVCVGQVWRSADPRDRRWVGARYEWRKVKVLGFVEDNRPVWAYSLIHDPDAMHAAVQNLSTGRLSRVALKRLLAGKDYELVT